MSAPACQRCGRKEDEPNRYGNPIALTKGGYCPSCRVVVSRNPDTPVRPRPTPKPEPAPPVVCANCAQPCNPKRIAQSGQYAGWCKPCRGRAAGTGPPDPGTVSALEGYLAARHRRIAEGRTRNTPTRKTHNDESR